MWEKVYIDRWDTRRPKGATRSSAKANAPLFIGASSRPPPPPPLSPHIYFVLRLCFLNSHDGQEAAKWSRYNSRRSSPASTWRFLPSPPFLLPYLSAYLCTCWLCFPLLCCSLSPPFFPCCSSWSASLNSLSWRNLGAAILCPILIPHYVLLLYSLYCLLLILRETKALRVYRILVWNWNHPSMFRYGILCIWFSGEFRVLGISNTVFFLLNQCLGKWREICTWCVGYRSIQFLLWL